MYGWNVQDDLRDGIKMGVTTVPTFFINGELFDKEPTFKNLSSHIANLADTKQKKVACWLVSDKS